MSNPLVFPVAGNDWSISSGFGARSAPLPGASTFHEGLDIAAPFGTPVVAPTDLQVTYAGQSRGFGNLVQAQDSAGNTYQFGHLSTMAVTAGQSLTPGSVLGAVGSTGNSTGNHLHFGIKDANGNYINPANVLSGALTTGLDKGKALLATATQALLLSNPITAPLAIAADAFGIGGGKSWLEQFRDWLANSHFWQRIGMAILGLIFIAAALYLLGSKQMKQTVITAAKAAVETGA